MPKRKYNKHDAILVMDKQVQISEPIVTKGELSTLTLLAMDPQRPDKRKFIRYLRGNSARKIASVLIGKAGSLVELDPAEKGILGVLQSSRSSRGRLGRTTIRAYVGHAGHLPAMSSTVKELVAKRAALSLGL